MYNPLDEKPKIYFDGSDWAILMLCIFTVLFFGFQILRVAV